MRVRALLTLAVLGAVAPPAHAVDSEVWTATFLQVAPTGGPTGPRFWLDLHARRNAAAMTGIVRPGLGWQVARPLSVWAGYAFVPSDPDDGPATLEHRAWEQASAAHTVDRVALSLRVRQEQRVRTGEPQVHHRLRAMPRVGVRIDGPVSLQVWDEVFLSYGATPWFDVAGYDQNRAFVGAGVEPASGWRVEAGYLNLDLARGPDSANQHVALVAVFANLGPRPEPAAPDDPAR